MANDLIQADQLADLPGAPFTQSAVDSAVSKLRRLAGWHIAPKYTETITMDGSETRLLVLPTLWLVDVTAVRDISGDTPVTLTGWRKSRAGMLRRAAGWPCGFGVLEVDLVHGYDDTPDDLFPLAAAMIELTTTGSDVEQESLGSWSVTFREALAQTHAETLEDYSLPRLA